MSSNGVAWDKGSSNWYPKIVREIDMSREKTNFLKKNKDYSIPIIEGRMIQQHRFGAKIYVSGSGRRSSWLPNKFGFSVVKPQYWIETELLSTKAKNRFRVERAGFCDIAGQTNERSMMAAIIPPGVVCGNKVPTILFPNDLNEERLFLWIGIVNSFPFDWLLRRVLTTTVNYFLLKSVHLPNIEPNSARGRKIIKLTHQIRTNDTSSKSIDLWNIAKIRAEIDIQVLAAYQLCHNDMEVILSDFPLLDRGQPSISGEKKSTITRDYLLTRTCEYFNIDSDKWSNRVVEAKKSGAIPYIYSENADIESLEKLS